MPRMTGAAAYQGGVARDCRSNGCLPAHVLVGGNTWAPLLLQDERWRLAAAADADALDASVLAARAMLQKSASLSVSIAQSASGKQAIVRSCAQLGRSLGLHVVAEGVETREEYEAVGRLGCTEVQGWLIGKPMPVAQAVEWLRALPDQRFAV